MTDGNRPKRGKVDGVAGHRLDPTCAGAGVFGPDELLVIYSSLEQQELVEVAQVCRLWGRVVDTPSLWEKVHFTNVGRNLFRMEEDMTRVLTTFSGGCQISFANH